MGFWQSTLDLIVQANNYPITDERSHRKRAKMPLQAMDQEVRAVLLLKQVMIYFYRRGPENPLVGLKIGGILFKLNLCTKELLLRPLKIQYWLSR